MTNADDRRGQILDALADRISKRADMMQYHIDRLLLDAYCSRRVALARSAVCGLAGFFLGVAVSWAAMAYIDADRTGAPFITCLINVDRECTLP